MLDGTETLITVTYDDEDGENIDFVVDSDLHNYSWTNVDDGDIPDAITVTGYMQDEDINTISELNSWVTDATLLISGGTLTTSKWCVFDGTGIDCNVEPVSDTDTTYTAGTGLELSSEVFSINETYLNDTIDARDDDTTYTASGTLLDLTGTAFSVHEGTLTNGKGCKFVTGTGIVCDQDYSTTTGTVTSVSGDGDYVTGTITTSGTFGFNETRLNATISALNSDTTLSEEEVEDYVGGMVTGNTETHISVDYQDDDGTIDFVVSDDWWNAIGDLPTNTPTDGDTANLSTSGQIYSFVTGLGYSSLGASIDDTEMTAEDFGEFTCTGDEDGCTLDSGTFDDEYIELGDTFSGDVSGTYDATVVADDSHNHSYTTITPMTEANLYSILTDVTEFIETGDAITVASINTGNGAKELGDASIVNDDTDSIPTSDQVYDFVTGLGYTSNAGTVTSVATDDTYLTGGAITTSGTITFNTTLAGISLAVNSSDYWDNLASSTDITALGTLTDLTVTNPIVGSITGNSATVTGFTHGGGSLTLSGEDAITLTTTGATGVTLPTTGTLATTSELHDAVTIGTANGLSLSTQALSLALSSTSTTGF